MMKGLKKLVEKVKEKAKKQGEKNQLSLGATIGYNAHEMHKGMKDKTHTPKFRSWNIGNVYDKGREAVTTDEAQPKHQ